MASNQTVNNTTPEETSTIKMSDKTLIEEPESKQSESVDFTFPSVSSIEQIMNSEGPVVKAVVLLADGSIKEIDYDTTPRLNQVTDILSAPPTIIGEWPELKVILVRGRHESKNVAVNQHKLRFPFQNQEFRGDILLYRMNDAAVQEDFTVNEYKEFAAKIDEDVQKVLDSEKESEEDKTEDVELSEEDMMSAEQLDAFVGATVKRQFNEKFGRDPSESEFNEWKSMIMGTFLSTFGIDIDDDEDDEEYNPEEDEEAEVDDDEEYEENVDVDNEEEEEQETVPTEEKEVTVTGEQWAQALESVRALGASDRQQVVKNVMERHEEETGQVLDSDTLATAFSLLKVGVLPTTEEETQEEVDEEAEDDTQPDAAQTEEKDDETEEVEMSTEDIEREIAEAFEVIRECGRRDGQKFARMVSETFYEINGREADMEEIGSIFKRIKLQLAEEDKEDFMEELQSELLDNEISKLPASVADTATLDAQQREQILNYSRSVVTQEMASQARANFVQLKGCEPSKREFEELLIALATTRFIDLDFDEDFEDEDYNPLEQSEQDQLKNDLAEDDVEDELQEEEYLQAALEVNGERPVQVAKPVAFFSPVGKKKTQSKTPAQSLTAKLLARAVKRFENTHDRKPNEEEIKNLEKFLKTNDDMPTLDFDSEEGDSDYDPQNDDTCDVEKDLADEEEFEKLAQEEKHQNKENVQTELN